MSPGVAGALGGAIVVAYVPALRRQVREGAIDVGHVGVRPIRVRRDQHPVAFRLCAMAVIAIVALLLGGSLLLVAEAIG